MTRRKAPAPPQNAPRPGPYRYSPSYAARALDACFLGASNKELGALFGVPETTIDGWLRSHEDFRSAVYLGRDGADERVSRALYHRAIGYSHTDVHISNYKGQITVTPITKYYPPEVGAAIYWLNNRQRGRWTSKPEDSQGSGDLGAALAQIIGGLPS